MDESQGDLGVVTEDTPPTNTREEMSEDEKSAAEIERVFGPVDEKQQDVEQVWVIKCWQKLQGTKPV